ncbi:hypothetical protein [Nostoc sp.]
MTCYDAANTNKPNYLTLGKNLDVSILSKILLIRKIVLKTT